MTPRISVFLHYLFNIWHGCVWYWHAQRVHMNISELWRHHFGTMPHVAIVNMTISIAQADSEQDASPRSPATHIKKAIVDILRSVAL